MKLKTKIIVFVIAILILTIGSISALSFVQMKTLLTKQLEDNLFNIAYSVSEDYLVKNYLINNSDEIHENLYTEIENIRVKTSVDFIVVMDMSGTRLTHPYKEKIGAKFEGGDEARVLTTGEQYASTSRGSLGNSLRVFVPIFENKKQIGAVSVGSSIDIIYHEIYSKIDSFIPFVIVGLILGIFSAALLATNIKKAIFGLEPKEIAWILKEKEAILENVKEGILAVDDKGKLTLFNKEASQILGLSERDIGISISDYTSESVINEVLKSGKPMENVEIKIRPGVTILCKYNPLKDKKEKVIGAVINFRDLTEVKKMAEELTGIKKMAWSLRAQNHEFMNKLHTISGLIQLEEYDEAISFITKTARRRDEISNILTEQIKNVSIAALLFAKYNKAEETRIKLKIDSDSNLTILPEYIREDELVSIIGNLLENSFDAIKTDGTGYVYFKISEADGLLKIEVKDNGPGISEDIFDTIYDLGTSTKLGQRGYGMYLVKKIIDEAHGEIAFENNNGASWSISIPLERSFVKND
ncbi:MAG: ATP-binding protein [Clostridiaceae bacterium]